MHFLRSLVFLSCRMSGPVQTPLLGLLLACLTLVTPSPLLAAARVVVLGLHTSGVEASRIPPVTSALEAALQQATNLSVVRDDSVRKSFSGQDQALQETLILAPVRTLIQDARAQAEEAAFDKAIATFLRAESHLSFYLQHLTDQTEMLEVQRSLVQLYEALGDRASVTLHMRRLVVLDPAYTLDGLRHSPELIERFSAVKAEMLALTGTIELVSLPGGASAWLNGRLVGTTPVTVKGLPLGSYLVRLASDTGKTFVQETQLNQTGLVHLGGALEAPSLYAEGRRAFPAEEAETQVLTLYRTFGRMLESDFVLLGRLKPDAIELQLLKVSDGARGPLYEAPLASDLSNLGGSLRNLVTQLDQLISPTGKLMRTSPFPLKVDASSNPILAEYLLGSAGFSAQGQTPVRRSPLKKGPPLVQQPWFWAVAGGLILGAAGGATGAVLSAMPDPPAATLIIQWP